MQGCVFVSHAVNNLIDPRDIEFQSSYRVHINSFDADVAKSPRNSFFVFNYGSSSMFDSQLGIHFGAENVLALVNLDMMS